MRLCAPIDGIDAATLAECLGLDWRKFAAVAAGPVKHAPEETEDVVLEKPVALFERLEKAPHWRDIPCPHCSNSVGLPRVFATHKCGTCSASLDQSWLCNALRLAVHALVAKYFEGKLQCDEPDCRRACRQVSVYGAGANCQFRNGGRCCPGVMRPVFGDGLLVDHLRLLHKLAQGAVPLEDVQSCPGLASVACAAIGRCKMNFIDVSSIFAPMYR